MSHEHCLIFILWSNFNPMTKHPLLSFSSFNSKLINKLLAVVMILDSEHSTEAHVHADLASNYNTKILAIIVHISLIFEILENQGNACTRHQTVTTH